MSPGYPTGSQLPTFFGLDGIADGDVGELGEGVPHDLVAGRRVICPPKVPAQASVLDLGN